MQILGVKNQGESIHFVLQTLQSGSTSQVLSAITVLHQLFDIMLSHTKQFGQAQIQDIINKYFDRLMQVLFQNKYKDLNIQKEIATLLPCFAQVNAEVFCKKYLKQTMEYLFDRTDKLGLLQTIG